MNSSIYQVIVITHATGMHSDSVVNNLCLGVLIRKSLLDILAMSRAWHALLMASID
jgi:hypothetical protein